jgi:hypothetical protein
MSKFKKFLGVYFGSGPRNCAKQWQIVPREWILDGGKKPYCYWPPDGDVEWLARTCTSPNPATWSKFVISRIAEESGVSQINEHFLTFLFHTNIIFFLCDLSLV